MKKILRVCSRFCRRISISLFIVLSIVVSLFAFLYCDIANKIIRDEKKDIDRCKYLVDVPYLVYGDSEIIDSISKANIKNVDIIVNGLTEYVGEIEMPRLIEISMTDSIYKYPIITGRYPNCNDLRNENTPCLVLGKAMKRYTYRKNDNDYILVNNSEYIVTGYIGLKTSNILDYSVILFYSNVSEEIKKDIYYYGDKMGVMVHFLSDISEDAVDEIENNAIDNNYVRTEDELFFASGQKEKIYRIMAMCIYLFSVVLIVLVMYYSYIIRRKEYAIKRTFGYSYFKLLWDIFIVFMIYIFMGVILSQGLVILVSGLDAVVSDIKSIISDNVVGVLKYVVSTVLLVMIVPAVQLRKEELINIVRSN